MQRAEYIRQRYEGAISVDIPRPEEDELNCETVRSLCQLATEFVCFYCHSKVNVVLSSRPCSLKKSTECRCCRSAQRWLTSQPKCNSIRAEGAKWLAGVICLSCIFLAIRSELKEQGGVLESCSSAQRFLILNLKTIRSETKKT